MSGCGGPPPGAAAEGHAEPDEKILNVANWADYIAPDTISSFERETGIKVNFSYYDSNDTLETRLLAGRSGLDVVFPTDIYLQQEIASGVYMALDRRLLPNWSNLDPELLGRAALNDPGNAHGIIYVWGTVGIGYNEQMVARVLPHPPVNSWRLLFDPTYAKSLAACGINFINEPVAVVRVALKYLGKDPNAPSPQDFDDVEKLLRAIRPYIRTFETSGDVAALINQEVCVSLGYGGDVIFANQRAQENNKPVRINYVVPDEGSVLWFSYMAIPQDAPHAANAHRFLDFLLRPRVIADISNAIGYANGNASSTALLDARVAGNPIIYPTPAERRRLFVETAYTKEQSRAMTRLWQRFKTAQY